MSLESDCRSLFEPWIRDRGREYQRKGRVTLAWTRGGEARAWVRGTSRYTVQVVRKPHPGRPGWDLACDCPYAGGGIPCKHMWATLLELDRRGCTLETSADRSVPPPPAPHPIRPEEARPVESGRAPWRSRRSEVPRKDPDRPPLRNWREALGEWRFIPRGRENPRPSEPSPALIRTSELWLVLDPAECRSSEELQIGLRVRQRTSNGSFGTIKKLTVTNASREEFAEPADRELLDLLLGMDGHREWGYGVRETDAIGLRPAVYDLILPRVCASGRFLRERPAGQPVKADRLKRNGPRQKKPQPGRGAGPGIIGARDSDRRRFDIDTPIQWDGGSHWELRVRLAPAGPEWFRFEGLFERAGETLLMQETDPMPASRLFLRTSGSGLLLSRMETGRNGEAGRILASMGPLAVPREGAHDFLERMYRLPEPPEIEVPEDLRWSLERGTPQPCLDLITDERDPKRCQATLQFEYGERIVEFAAGPASVPDRSTRSVFLRDPEAEQILADRLGALGILPARTWGAPASQLTVKTQAVPEIVRVLVSEGWTVRAEKVQVRSGGRFRGSVSSGIDWFELDGALEFDGASAPLPSVLEALARGASWVVLDDGSHGMLPQDWLERVHPLLALAQKDGRKIRFRTSQAMLLDVLLESEPGIDIDETFARIRDRLRTFEGITAQDPAAGFRGTLRDYQKLGLGWLGFLREFGLGGCLADDMGLGKTVQVLALLERVHGNRNGNGNGNANGTVNPSLVVAPRSLIHNWKDEAARFAPGLRVLDHNGPERDCSIENFSKYDLVLATYGTVRRDVMELREIPFEYAILDEAQAIKNSGSLAAKAARLILASHRLALTGTPIENHMGELWSLFEFLNPGMLGSAAGFKGLVRSNGAGVATTPDSPGPAREGDKTDPGRFDALARALRPFLLRRTKEAVLSELPSKTEQTLYCELTGPERRNYDELAAHYRASLRAQVGDAGWNRSQIFVLEALLRLRQAACHPGLLDPRRKNEPSAKLEALLAHIEEVTSEGHKALVFSQFTSMLAILRARLDALGIVYEYLDGKTRDRRTCVTRFQEDPACPLFLISLRAGGHGLNLTAADYVFLLDPWWNPAVEAQAIDRAHRIGQDRPVFAYRLVAQDTVEEKILKLQEEKRGLSEAILKEDAGMLSALTAEDLEMLLGGAG